MYFKQLWPQQGLQGTFSRKKISLVHLLLLKLSKVKLYSSAIDIPF